jgi:hypothetical protein
VFRRCGSKPRHASDAGCGARCSSAPAGGGDQVRLEIAFRIDVSDQLKVTRILSEHSVTVCSERLAERWKMAKAPSAIAARILDDRANSGLQFVRCHTLHPARPTRERRITREAYPSFVRHETLGRYPGLRSPWYRGHSGRFLSPSDEARSLDGDPRPDVAGDALSR